jgi:hypothetical protein
MNWASAKLRRCGEDPKHGKMGTDVNELRFERWRLQCDPESTRRALAGCVGSPEPCGCTECRNFAAARHLIYPPIALQLFERLGIDAACKSEIYYGAPMAAGLHIYGGWFHCIGTVEEGPDADALVTEGFKLGFTTHLGLAPPAFGDAPLVQLEFEAMAPWVLGTSGVIP